MTIQTDLTGQSNRTKQYFLAIKMFCALNAALKMPKCKERNSFQSIFDNIQTFGHKINILFGCKT